MHLTVDGHAVYAYSAAKAFDPAQTTVVFVHGAANDHSVFALQSRYFAHHGRNVLALDLPGHGRSGGDPLPSVDALAAWLPRVLDAAGARDAAFVGHSLGALAVLACAAAAPARVTRIALLGPAVPMVVSDALLAAAQADDHVAFELICGWSHTTARQLGGNPVPGMWMTGTSLRLMERSRPGALYVDLRACHEWTNGIAAAAGVRCPALVVMGQRDLMAPLRGAQALIAALAQCEAVTLPATGHALMAEAPDAVLDALRAFL